MNKYTVITVVAIVVIIIPFAYSGLSILGAQQMEYRWHFPGEFSFFTMSNHGEMEFCNTMPFWTSFQKFEVGVFYNGNHLGSYTVKPLTLNPLSSGIQEGKFSSQQLENAQHTFMNFDFEFDTGDIRLDPNQFVSVIQTTTPIIGVIPYSSTTQISGFEFDQIMKVEDLTCD